MFVNPLLSFAENSGTVSVSGTKFTLNGKPFHYAGTNTYYLMEKAAQGDYAAVDEIFGDAQKMGLNVIRTWAFDDGPGGMQTAPGVYDPSYLQGLDYVLHKADQMGIRVILPFVNNWDDYGGMNQYVDWNGGGSHDDFYTNTTIKGWYKNHISTLLDRVNSYNGRTYKNDPTIFSWELANEPRAQSDHSGDTMYNWIVEMSDHVKSIDSQHMLTVGMEGFYDEDSGPWYKNGSQGTDFIRDHQIANIDFATAHSYPDHWGMDKNTAMNFFQKQINDTRSQLGKPVILEEFGKQGSTRDDFYDGYYNKVYNNLDVVGGSNYWTLYHDSYPDYDKFGVYYPTDVSTIDLIETKGAKGGVLNYDFDMTTQGWKEHWGGIFGSIQQEESIGLGWTDNGSLQVNLDLVPNPGPDPWVSGGIRANELPGWAGFDYSVFDYDEFTAWVYAPSGAPTGPGGLQAELYSNSGGGYTYSGGGYVHLVADSWTEITLPTSWVHDITDVKWLGLQIGADVAYDGPIYIDYVGGLQAQETAPIPEPSTLILMGVGLFGTVMFYKRRKNRQNSKSAQEI